MKIRRIRRALETHDLTALRHESEDPRLDFFSRCWLAGNNLLIELVRGLQPKKEEIPYLLAIASACETGRALAHGILFLVDRLGDELYELPAVRQLTIGNTAMLAILLREHCYRCEVPHVLRVLSMGGDPHALLSSPDASVQRVCGKVVRLLIDAGGTPSEHIAALCERKEMPGDD